MDGIPVDHLTAYEMLLALSRGETSSHELVLQALARADAAKDLGAFVRLNPLLALEEAEVADARIAAARSESKTREPGSRAPESRTPEHRPLAPSLLGLPTAHKDLVEVRGIVTTHGSRAVPHLAAESDDPIAAAVRAAGAVSIGKTQVPEFGIAGYSENDVAPPARNPYDPKLTAGGSSGGTAAAIAAGVIPGAIASDAGGSIRIPAAACGLVGLKPGRGVVPADRQPGIAGDPSAAQDEAGAPLMGVSGPIARNARDAALLFDAVRLPGQVAGQVAAQAAGRDPSRDPGDARGADAALDAVERVLADPSSLRGLRIGVSYESPFAGWAEIRFDEDARRAVDAAVASLSVAGHAVEEAGFAYDPQYPESFTTVWTAALARIPFEPGAEERLGELAAMFLSRARSTGPDRLLEAAARLRAFAKDARQQWGQFDVVLTPALAFAPPRVGEFRALGPEGDYRLQCEWAPQTSMVNVAGLPAITVPTLGAADADGRVPRGVQLIGRAGAEPLLLQLAAQLTGA